MAVVGQVSKVSRYLTPRCISARCSSSLSAAHMINENSRFGILGGGLAGLTSAYYLAKRLPESNQIIVWEKTDRFGGWVQSSRVEDQTNGASFVFESGPRSVRPKGLAGLISLELGYDIDPGLGASRFRDCYTQDSSVRQESLYLHETRASKATFLHIFIDHIYTQASHIVDTSGATHGPTAYN